MIHDTFLVLLWITTILLIISGIDDLYMDLLFWFLKGRHKSKFPDFSIMFDKVEKPVAILLCAWKESAVIGRTLSYAITNIRYKNYKIFVGVYPNDLETIKAVKEMSKQDSRIIACINPQNGPTTKADNLNSIYAGLSDYEKLNGEFEILIIHDAEDFIHPGSLKLFNFLIGYKGYHGIQIPVVPIKSKAGKLFHRTYCDAFAEIHTKDLIVRQGMGTFMPFAGTGMGFHRKVMYYLDKTSSEKRKMVGMKDIAKDKVYYDSLGRKIELSNNYFDNNEEDPVSLKFKNKTKYEEDPFRSIQLPGGGYKRTTKTVIRDFTCVFLMIVLSGISFLIYSGNTTGKGTFLKGLGQTKDLFITNAYAKDINDSNDNPKTQLNLEPGFYDKIFDVLYILLKDGKIGIQESVWSSSESANKRLQSILIQPSLNTLKGFVAKVKDKKGNDLYKVIIGNFDNLNQCQRYTSEIRQYFQNN